MIDRYRVRNDPPEAIEIARRCRLLLSVFLARGRRVELAFATSASSELVLSRLAIRSLEPIRRETNVHVVA